MILGFSFNRRQKVQSRLFYSFFPFPIGIILSHPPDEQQLLSPPDWEGTQAHHAQVQQHEEEAAQPVLDPPCVHPSILEDQPQGDSCHQGSYEVDKNEEGVAVQLAHEAGG